MGYDFFFFFSFVDKEGMGYEHWEWWYCMMEFAFLHVFVYE